MAADHFEQLVSTDYSCKIHNLNLCTIFGFCFANWTFFVLGQFDTCIDVVSQVTLERHVWNSTLDEMNDPRVLRFWLCLETADLVLEYGFFNQSKWNINDPIGYNHISLRILWPRWYLYGSIPKYHKVSSECPKRAWCVKRWYSLRYCLSVSPLCWLKQRIVRADTSWRVFCRPSNLANSRMKLWFLPERNRKIGVLIKL